MKIPKENYRCWKPVEHNLSHLLVCSLSDSDCGLKILLGADATSPVVEIFFDAHSAYRNMDESYRPHLPKLIEGSGQHSLFIVENSGWIDWFHKESANIYSESPFVHYAIITAADCIDVISEFAPKVSYVTDME